MFGHLREHPLFQFFSSPPLLAPQSASTRQSFAATKPSALTSTGSAISSASSISRTSFATITRIFSRKKSKKVTEAAAVALAGTLSSGGASDAEGGAASPGGGGGSRSIVLPSSTGVLPGEGKDKGKPDKDIIGLISFKVGEELGEREGRGRGHHYQGIGLFAAHFIEGRCRTGVTEE